MGDIFFRCKTRGGGRTSVHEKRRENNTVMDSRPVAGGGGEWGPPRFFWRDIFSRPSFLPPALRRENSSSSSSVPIFTLLFSVCGRELGMSADAASVAGANIGRSRPLHLALKTEEKNRDFLHLGNANMHARLVWRREEGGRKGGEWEKPPRNGVKYIT